MVEVKQIPAELRALPQWVGFNERKEPINPKTGELASSIDPRTWSDLDTAMRAAERFHLKGIGFVFTREVKIVGIDLDECRDPETGAIMPAAQKIIDDLDSYTEISPSRKGVHILCRGARPIDEGKNRSMPEFGFKKIEMYSQKRYFTVTGDHLEGTPTTIEERSAELAALHSKLFEPETKPHQNGFHQNGNASVLSLSDMELIAKAKGARNGGKFSRLWGGDTSDYGGDDSSADLALCMMLSFYTGRDAERIDRLFRQSGLYREKWERADYRARTINAAIAGTDDTYGSKKNDSGPERADPPSVKIEHLTDLGNAKRLVAQHGKDLRFCYLWNTWLVWDGRRWKKDDTGEIKRRAKETVVSIYKEAAGVDDDEIRKRIAAHAVKSESDARIEAMISLSKSEAEVVVTPERLDADSWLLNVENGTIDLRTGELHPHRRENLITRLVPIQYDPEAGCPRWEEFLSDVMDGKDDLVDFLWKGMGYSLTGQTSEQCVFLMWGSGSNGKSTFIELFETVLGEYGISAPTTTFYAKRDQIPNDVARLAGQRLVTAIETEKGRRLSEPLVKSMTGGDKIQARFLHQEFFEFRPTFKVWLATNHRPRIVGTEHAIWRRIRLIPFLKTFPLNPTFADGLRAELPGILAWTVRGCLSWQAERLPLPEAVRAATEEYRAEMDGFAVFLADCTVLDPDARTATAELYRRYTRWADEMGERKEDVLSQTAFGGALTEKGFRKVRSNQIRYWEGLKVTG